MVKIIQIVRRALLPSLAVIAVVLNHVADMYWASNKCPDYYPRILLPCSLLPYKIWLIVKALTVEAICATTLFAFYRSSANKSALPDRLQPRTARDIALVLIAMVAATISLYQLDTFHKEGWRYTTGYYLGGDLSAYVILLATIGAVACSTGRRLRVGFALLMFAMSYLAVRYHTVIYDPNNGPIKF